MTVHEPSGRGAKIKPGEYFLIGEAIELNKGGTRLRFRSQMLESANSGGSHYCFAEANSALNFDRSKSVGYRLNIAAGTAMRFEPGVSKTVELVELGGSEIFSVFGEKSWEPWGLSLDKIITPSIFRNVWAYNWRQGALSGHRVSCRSGKRFYGLWR